MSISLELKRKIVRSVDDLPPIPQVVTKIKETMAKPNCTAKHIADLVSTDQALATKVLKLANSPYYGVLKPINNIQQGVAFLGFNTLHNLVLAGSLYKIYERDLKGYKMLKGQMWEHSVYAAFAAEMLADRTGKKPLKEVAFTAGLIHDIGKLVMSTYIGQVFDSVMEMVEQEKVSFLEAEKRLLGFDHAEIGSEVARKWRFPLDLVAAIRYHHTPKLVQGDPELVSVVHLADVACLMMGKGVGVDSMYYEMDPGSLKALNMVEDDLQGVIFRLSSSVDMSLLEQ
ncbi:MAG: HDOD domain-containing protein [Nitrospirae bacterium]|nr:HDOD domain-containing protein [Nitrospirota bacterium]